MTEPNNFNPSKIPTNYPLCLNRQCPLASTCLRQLVERHATNTSEYWHIISPRCIEAQQGQCVYYRPSAKVRFAKGFLKMLDNMTYKQMRLFVEGMANLFSERTYYRIRKGERLISPAQQEKIYQLLNACGVEGRPEFDAYVEDYEW